MCGFVWVLGRSKERDWIENDRGTAAESVQRVFINCSTSRRVFAGAERMFSSIALDHFSVVFFGITLSLLQIPHTSVRPALAGDIGGCSSSCSSPEPYRRGSNCVSSACRRGNMLRGGHLL